MTPKSKYVVIRNGNIRLLEYGFTEGSIVTLELIFSSWIYVFTVRGSKIGVRKSDLNQLVFGECNDG